MDTLGPQSCNITWIESLVGCISSPMVAEQFINFNLFTGILACTPGVSTRPDYSRWRPGLDSGTVFRDWIPGLHSGNEFHEPWSRDGSQAHIFLPRMGTACTKVLLAGSGSATLYCLGFGKSRISRLFGIFKLYQ